MRVVTIVGARPQFIKAAAISRTIASHNATRQGGCSPIDEIIVHTGQHFDGNMSDIFFSEMGIPKPVYQLSIDSLNHGAMTGRMLERIEEILLKEKPDVVLVYGDTNSTLAGVLAAKKLHIAVAHVEAGLRSFNMEMPEEVNRILTDRISDMLFCPTDTAVANLHREGFTEFPCQIVKTGDVMLDAVLFYRELAVRKSNVTEQLGLEGREFALCTIHRAENTDDPGRLKALMDALVQLSGDLQIVFPLHPRTAMKLKSLGIKPGVHPIDALTITPPLGYFDMIRLLEQATIVLTDSGGLQKEAFFLKKPCITLRDETEWVELVEHGVNRLVGANKDSILRNVREMMGSYINFDLNLYGNGQASKMVVENLEAWVLSRNG